MVEIRIPLALAEIGAVPHSQDYSMTICLVNLKSFVSLLRFATLKRV